MRLLTLTQVSKETQIKRRTLYNMLKDGRFNVPSVPGHKPRRWLDEDVREWIKSGPRE